MISSTSSNNNNSTILPSKFDVLCGRSPEERAHSGNVRMMTCVELHKSQYLNAPKCDKSKIIRNIVHAIEKEGGRFLKRELNGEYTLLPPRSTREKVGLAMRELIDGGADKKKKKKRQQQKKKNPSTANTSGIATSRKKSTNTNSPNMTHNQIISVSVSEPSSPKSANGEIFDESTAIVSTSSSIMNLDESAEISNFLNTLDEFCLQEVYASTFEVSL